MADFRIVIPARYASVRLPGKPLREINGKSMIEWVYRAAEAAEPAQVIVATDDQRILDCVKDFGGDACMTAEHHQSGTDRILEVARQLDWRDDDVVVNLQGDEPLMPAVNLAQVAENLVASGCDMATLYKEVDAEHARDPNLVKLVRDRNGHALYFSRSPIPYDRSQSVTVYYGHIGLYAYRVGFIDSFSRLPPGELEQAEALEQLRALANGYSVHTDLARELPGPGIDTEDDLRRVTRLMETQA